MEFDIDRLIRENAEAPADTIIREIYRMKQEGLANEVYIDDGYDDPEYYNSVKKALEHWYNVDGLIIYYVNNNNQRHWVRLIHQIDFGHPSIDDISDYHVGCEKDPIGEILTRPYEDWPYIYR